MVAIVIFQGSGICLVGTSEPHSTRIAIFLQTGLSIRCRYALAPNRFKFLVVSLGNCACDSQNFIFTFFFFPTGLCWAALDTQLHIKI